MPSEKLNYINLKKNSKTEFKITLSNSVLKFLVYNYNSNLSPVNIDNVKILPYIVKLTCITKTFIHKKLKTKY